MKVVGFAGFSGSGKTTLVEQLIPELRLRGLRVSVVKHAHHSFDIDHPGKDTYRHREAGAFEVVAASDKRLMLVREFEQPATLSVHHLLAELYQGVDWVLVEGFKDSDLLKVEVWRAPEPGQVAKSVRYPEDDFVVAVATDAPGSLPVPTQLPLLDLNAPAQVVDWLIQYEHRFEYNCELYGAGAGMNRTHKPLKPLDEALAELLAHAAPLPGADTVTTFDADGRVLAQDCISALQVPPQDNSSMDGYAVRCADVAATGVVLSVSQRIAAGSAGEPLAPGTAARIFTGAPVPAGADAILMQEDCEAQPAADGEQSLGQVRINAVPPLGQWIRRAGEDITRGAVVLAAGTRLSPAELGLAASIGLHQVQVARRPRVALFSTGDELVMPGEVPPEQMRPGAIYNSNRFFLRALLLRLGCEVTDFGIVPDRRDATIAALRDASAAHDLILTSGGVSVGEEDHIKPAVESLGTLDLWQIAMKPGKPFAYGRIGAAHFMGLPGNPVSSFLTFALLVRPFVLRLQGVRDVAPQSVAVRADFNWPKADKRREFLRVRHNAADGLDLFGNQSSGVLTSAAWGDGVVDNPAGQTIAVGDTVQYIAFSELLA